MRVNGAGASAIAVVGHGEAHATFPPRGGDLHVTVPIGSMRRRLAPRSTSLLLMAGPPAGSAGHAEWSAFSYRGRGAPSPRSGLRGDVVVEVKIMLPRTLDERSKELLREFGKITVSRCGDSHEKKRQG